uniref:AAA+ ATPase domain-containing protein n=1 Tax=Esox lucius TaxID=8010 RepID=A0AAY5K8C5_ESOLU
MTQEGGRGRGRTKGLGETGACGRLPVSSNLRKQRSLTNLAVLTDAEKKMHLYEPKWSDDMAKPGAGGGGGVPLSRNLSKSEHSLFQGKPKPFSPLAAPSGLVRPGQSRIPRGPYAEVKPLSKAPEDGKSDDEILSSKAKTASKKQVAGASGEAGAKGQGEGSQSFLKVDPELVVTVLGDLEQLLFSQMLDPESQRKRTVQNVLDLRQNLEDTMSSLRGAQLSHGCLESSNICYDSDETNARSMSSLSNRSSPLSWRHGQSSPRLQAGDAPSSTGSSSYQGGKAGSQYTAHTMPARVSSRLSHSSRIELIEGLDMDDADLKSGYLSDSDLLGKSMPEDDDDNLANGINIITTFSCRVPHMSNPPPPHRVCTQLRTDAEKRSLVESGLSWYSEDAKTSRKMDGGSYETGSLKTETPSKWRKSSRPMEGPSEDMGLKGELRKPQSLGQPGNFKKGRNPPVGVTSPITHTSQSVLKVAAPKSDHKAVDRTKMSLKASGLQRSRSDAGREHLPEHREHRKPPSGLVKPSAGASFGYKKPPTTGTATVMTAGGSTISSGSATVGKMPKSSGIPVKPIGVGGGGGGRCIRKNSFDATSSEEGGFLGPNARNSLQYRSLPRPAKSSTLSLIGRPGSARSANSNSNMDHQSLLNLKPIARGKETCSGSAKGTNRGSTGPVNQTDREKEKERAKAKAVASDMESLCGSLKLEECQGDSVGDASSKLQGLRRASSSKYPELSSPTTQRYSHPLDTFSHFSSPTGLSYSGTNLLCGICAPRITRSNSIPTNEAACDLYGSSPLGSSMSLADRPKSMMRSGSFREPGDDCETASHTLCLQFSPKRALLSSFSQQIRKLRRELENSQEKVANLTTQLSANDSELTDLKETIEILKTKNTEAQDIIHVALSNPDTTPKELQMKRQNSSESISSLNSVTSHSSMGSLKEQEAKKKKKKSWLRSSFNKAFSKKGSKLSALYADIEEIATPDSSAPSSPKITIHHDEGDGDGDQYDPPSSMRLCEGGEEPPEDEKVVSTLRSALWEKERKLTDIRLEALSSAHQLEQLQEAMTNMQMTVENLKAENDQLKTGGPSTSTSQSSGLASLGSASPRQSIAMSLTKTFTLNTVTLFSSVWTHFWLKQRLRWMFTSVSESSPYAFLHQCLRFPFYSNMSHLPSSLTCLVFSPCPALLPQVYVAKVDPTSSLGLSPDSIYSYTISHIKRVLGEELPESQPSRCVSKGPSGITVTLKGLKEKCVDSLVFETLIPKPMTQHYISLLLKHRRLIMSGPSGTGKTYLTSRLAEYLVDRSGREVADGLVVNFNMHRQSCKDLQLFLSNIANQIDRETSTAEIPLVVILDDIHDAASISELVNGALTCKYHKCPYIIGTTNQPVKMTPNHGLHLSFRMVTFSNNVEPANGFLVRYLHRKLMEAEAEDEKSLANEDLLRVLDWVPKLWYHLHTFLEKHSTSDFLIGPCFFLSCPVTVEEFRSWFIDLWNLSIIPYLQEGAKDGIKMRGQKAVWEDPVEWVRGTLPWPSAQQDQAKLFHLPPPSMASGGGPVQPSEASARPLNKETPPSSMDTLDPLVRQYYCI